MAITTSRPERARGTADGTTPTRGEGRRRMSALGLSDRPATGSPRKQHGGRVAGNQPNRPRNWL